MRNKNPIPGIDTHEQTSFAVLKPFNATPAGEPEDLLFSRWLASTPAWVWLLMIAVVIAWPITSYAASGYTMTDAFQALWRWLPFVIDYCRVLF